MKERMHLTECHHKIQVPIVLMKRPWTETSDYVRSLRPVQSVTFVTYNSNTWDTSVRVRVLFDRRLPKTILNKLERIFGMDIKNKNYDEEKLTNASAGPYVQTRAPQGH